MTKVTTRHNCSAQQIGERTPWGQHALLYVVFFLMGAEMYLVSPLLPEISHAFGASTAQAATVVTAYVVVYAVAGPPLGLLADRYPRKRSAIAGAVVFLIGNAGCAAAPSLGALVAARGVTGLGAALAAPAIWAYLAERTATHQRGRAISLGASVYSLGQVLGVPLGALLADAGGWQAPFLGVSILMALATVTLAGRLESTPVAATPRGAGALVRPWRSPHIRLGLVSTFLLQAGRLGAYTYIGALFAERFGLPLSALGLVGLLVGAGSMAGSLVAGTTLDRLTRIGVRGTWVSVASALLFIPCAAVASMSHHLPIALVALALWCVFGGGFYSSQQTHLASADPTQRASVVAWNNSMMNAGIAVGTTVLGATAAGGPTFAAITCLFGLGAAVAAAIPLIGRAVTLPGR
ncbi:MFS transporter [Tsukamurella sp. 8F]|uniref:MFS transporter n=1 Tax=unclassified Tsukamurella TaxID=2633480 RepID=UPI0023BA0F97|nr:MULTISPECIES: MFS transporter [unclassified Tsukamurella]MDF0529368.1 MFS transporter [Tsukamurella sp. 8J]MDF0587125.1 MFS transporter [Tsukamurella sp. 8F]